MINLIQMKMNGGDEVICEVMEWPEEGSKQMIVRNAMVLSYSFGEDFSEQYYGLKPWFSMIENSMEYMVVNTDHVMSSTKPNTAFVREYNEALIQMQSIAAKRKAEYQNEVKEFEKRFSERLEKVTKEMMESKDSSSTNVLQFPPPDTSIH